MPLLPPPIEKPDISSSNMEFLKLELERLATEKVGGCACGGGEWHLARVGGSGIWRSSMEPLQLATDMVKGAEERIVWVCEQQLDTGAEWGGRGHVTGGHASLSTHTGAVRKWAQKSAVFDC
jgi:hypothetical protein